MGKSIATSDPGDQAAVCEDCGESITVSDVMEMNIHNAPEGDGYVHDSCPGDVAGGAAAGGFDAAESG